MLVLNGGSASNKLAVCELGEIVHFADSLASLAAVDGVLVLTQQVALVGSGMEIQATPVSLEHMYRALDVAGHTLQAVPADHGDIRHRARPCLAPDHRGVAGWQRAVRPQPGGVRSCFGTSSPNGAGGPGLWLAGCRHPVTDNQAVNGQLPNVQLADGALVDAEPADGQRPDGQRSDGHCPHGQRPERDGPNGAVFYRHGRNSRTGAAGSGRSGTGHGIIGGGNGAATRPRKN